LETKILTAKMSENDKMIAVGFEDGNLNILD